MHVPIIALYGPMGDVHKGVYPFSAFNSVLLTTHGLHSGAESLDVQNGVYPQDDGSIAIVDIDASKGFIDLWVHFFVAIEDNFFNGKGVFWVSTKFKHV